MRDTVTAIVGITRKAQCIDSEGSSERIFAHTKPLHPGLGEYLQNQTEAEPTA